MIKPRQLFFSTVFLGICSATQVSAALTEQNLIYTNNEMLHFNIEEYLSNQSPHLLPYAEAIRHWASISTISPKVLLALMEQQSSIVSIESETGLHRPFGDLSDKEGFKEQLMDVGEQLSFLHYQQNNAEEHVFPVGKLLFSHLSGPLNLININTFNNRFAKIYEKMFDGAAEDNSSTTLDAAAANTDSIPASNLLQLPYPTSNSWFFGGSHSFTGSGSVFSSLDFYESGNWNDDLRHLWVVAAAPGTVIVHSSCNMEIIHENDWSTQYYHLDNIQYQTGDTVERDANIANYASNKSQALCEGGQSTGPHLHFSLKRDGSYMSLQDVQLSSYTVNVGTVNYDTNCNRFYLYEADGSKHCAYESLYNVGVSDNDSSTPTPIPTPTPTPAPEPTSSSNGILANGETIYGLSAASGEELRFTIDVPANRKELMIQTNANNGDADLYVRYGSDATLNSYDCRPYADGSSEWCRFDNPRQGRYYIMISAYKAFSNLSITATY